MVINVLHHHHHLVKAREGQMKTEQYHKESFSIDCHKYNYCYTCCSYTKIPSQNNHHNFSQNLNRNNHSNKLNRSTSKNVLKNPIIIGTSCCWELNAIVVAVAERWPNDEEIGITYRRCWFYFSWSSFDNFKAISFQARSEATPVGKRGYIRIYTRVKKSTTGSSLFSWLSQGRKKNYNCYNTTNVYAHRCATPPSLARSSKCAARQKMRPEATSKQGII